MTSASHTRLPRTEQALRHPFTQLGFGLLAWSLLYYNWLLFWYASAINWNDFGKFFYAAAAWRAGGDMYGTSEITWMRVGDASMHFLDLNPPHFHLVVLPMINWPVRTAAVVWSVANIACAIAAIAIAWREVRPAVHASRLLPLACAGLATAATGANAITVQCTGLLMLPMTLAWRAARRENWNASGAWMGILISLKPFLALFLPVFLLRREIRTFMWACLTGTGCALTGVVVFGWQLYFEWFRALGNVTWAWASMNASIRGVLSRTFEMSPTFTPALREASVVTPLWIVASALIVVASVSAVQRSADRAFAVTTLASLLISPLGWSYYLWLAFPGCLALWRRGAPRAAWIAVALTCTPLFAMTLGQPSGTWTLVVGSAYAWGLVIIWVAAVRDAREATDVG